MLRLMIIMPIIIMKRLIIQGFVVRFMAITVIIRLVITITRWRGVVAHLFFRFLETLCYLSKEKGFKNPQSNTRHHCSHHWSHCHHCRCGTSNHSTRYHHSTCACPSCSHSTSSTCSASS